MAEIWTIANVLLALASLIGVAVFTVLWLLAALRKRPEARRRYRRGFGGSLVLFLISLFLPEVRGLPSEPESASAGMSAEATVEAGATSTPAQPSADDRSATPAARPASESCEIGAPTGETFRVRGRNINIRTGPGAEHERVVNEKASAALGETVYAQLDSSFIVRELCRHGGWSRIATITPDWLADSHNGWVASRYLVSEVDFTATGFREEDLFWDEDTLPYKEIVLEGVNRLHRQDPRCKTLDPATVAKSSTKGTAADPVFFVTCGTGGDVVNVFFSKSDVESDVVFKAPGHIDSQVAIELCERYAKSAAAHPSTVEFSRFLDLSVQEYPNGRTRVTSSFTARNAFNLELEYAISCLLDESGLIEATIQERE